MWFPEKSYKGGNQYHGGSIVTTSALTSQDGRQIYHVDGSKKMILIHHETPVLSYGPVGDGRRLRKIDTVETVATAQFRSYRSK
jgi:hypothetical protein